MHYLSNFTASHWEVVAAGIKAEIVTAKDLWELALCYFQWCDSNPIQKPEMLRSSGEIRYIPIPRPYTLSGMCIHLGITKEYIYSASRSDNKDEFYFITNKLLEIIHTQKLEYTYAGVYSAVIATKELGLHHLVAPERASPIINITVEESPKLLTDERDVELPEDKK